MTKPSPSAVREENGKTWQQLAIFDSRGFDRGGSRVVEALWIFVQATFVRSWLPGSAHRRFLLRLFGAKIGKAVVVKPGLRVKFPWRLDVGDHSWIGEDVWIDNLAPVRIGSNCCLSQAVYLCTGSHDHTKATFDLIVRPIVLRDGAWLAARSVVAPGVEVGAGAVLGLQSVATKDLRAGWVHAGVPAVPIRPRPESSVEPDRSS